MYINRFWKVHWPVGWSSCHTLSKYRSTEQILDLPLLFLHINLDSHYPSDSGTQFPHFQYDMCMSCFIWLLWQFCGIILRDYLAIHVNTLLGRGSKKGGIKGRLLPLWQRHLLYRQRENDVQDLGKETQDLKGGIKGGIPRETWFDH